MAGAEVQISFPGEAARQEKHRRARRRVLAATTPIVRATAGLWATIALAAAARSLYGNGHLGYDAGWSLLWGKQVAAGQLPAFQAPGAPTPHPLTNVVAAVLSHFGDAAGDLLLGIGTLCFGLLCWATYRLGTRLFDRPTGVLFAAIVFTRPSLINSQAQALVDIPFVALIMLAAALEAERPRRGGAVLSLLILAGLLRPEGWIFMGAYVLYLLPARRTRRRRAVVLATAAIAPCAWAAFDFIVTGDPLFSLHGTQRLAAELNRPRSFAAALSAAPTSFADILGTPLAITGLIGFAAAVLMLRRALLPIAIIGCGVTGFLALGLAGLPVLTRYLTVAVIMLALFAAVALLGWRTLKRDDWRRTPWIAGAAMIAVLVALNVPTDIQRATMATTFLEHRRAIQNDLHALTAAPAWANNTELPIHVTTRRAVPLLAAWLDQPTQNISAEQPPPGTRVLLIRHATALVATNYYSLTTPAWSPAPDPTVTWQPLYTNKSWILYMAQPRQA